MVMPRRMAIEAKAPDRMFADRDDQRFVACVIRGRGNCVIKRDRLLDCSFALIFLRRA